ncbi:MAG TPA: adenylate/guanylate cyclase domain-containing protein [Caldithrix abyssi]|uniref:Adenylate/guanylate cyclase domain-containing protein n=1 Tax=Caldithrix abyssi TaxID=187145 RepID=A0A7V1PVU3_CALAY|nr:adenylate/guanylate cyclase domain-containing protein [Caldithrix abyssi]
MQAYAFVKEHFDILFSHIVHNAGGVIKTIGDAVMAVFREPVNAVRAAFELKISVNRLFDQKGQKKENYGLRVSISNGTALIVNMNDVLDLFGTTVNVSARIIKFSEKDSVAATPGITENKEVREFLMREGIVIKSLNEKLKGFTGLNRIEVLSPKSKWFFRIKTE